MPALQLFLLGSLEIQHNGQPLPKPPTLKARSLFAYLALHRQRSQPRERLAALFWGDRPERKARRSLTTALWHIRRSLPPPYDDWLTGDIHAIQFDPESDLWLDVVEFESPAARSELACLQSAAALYRGPFMDGFYHDWVLDERYRLEALFSKALARLMVGLEAVGDHGGALATALRLLDHDPLREDAHRLAIRAFCRLGRRNAALGQHRRCQQIVAQELGARPMEETAALHQAILDGRLEIGPAIQAPAAAERRKSRKTQNPVHSQCRRVDSLRGRLCPGTTPLPKENFAPADADRLLEALAGLPIQTYNLKAQPPALRHLGPVAQDFNGMLGYLFGEVESPVRINNMDAVGVALAAAQGLQRQSQEQAARIERLQKENAALRAELDGLVARVQALEDRATSPAGGGFLPWAGALLSAVGVGCVLRRDALLRFFQGR